MRKSTKLFSIMTHQTTRDKQPTPFFCPCTHPHFNQILVFFFLLSNPAFLHSLPLSSSFLPSCLSFFRAAFSRESVCGVSRSNSFPHTGFLHLLFFYLFFLFPPIFANVPSAALLFHVYRRRGFIAVRGGRACVCVWMRRPKPSECAETAQKRAKTLAEKKNRERKRAAIRV